MTYLTGPEEHAYDYPTIMVQGTVTGFSHEHAEVKYAFHIHKDELRKGLITAEAVIDRAFNEIKQDILQRIKESNI